MRKGSSRMETRESRTLALVSSSVSRKVPRECGWDGDATVTEDGGLFGGLSEELVFGEAVLRGEAADNCSCERPRTL
jgi:hypothetical protein